MSRKALSTSLLSLIALAMVVGITFAQSPRTAPSTEREQASEGSPKVMAVYFHADWCGYCKQLGEKYVDLRNKFDDKPVLYVKLDQTTTSDRRQAKYMAHALGMDSAWTEHGNKTGFILYVDGQTRRVLGRVTHDKSMGEIGSELEKALRDAS